MQNIISFSYLYDILRKEKVNNGLTKLEYDLFDNIEDYLKIKKEILQNAKNSNNNKKIEQIEEELKTIIDIVKQVYKTRLSKTIELAKNALEYDNINEEVLENLSKFTSAKIGLIIDNRLIKYSEKKVQYSLNIQQISERIIVEIPVKVINKVKGLRVFPSPQTVSLTVIGGSTQISKIKSSDISVIVDFKDWVLEKKFYIPTVLIPFDILSWTDLSPRAIEIGVARESK